MNNNCKVLVLHNCIAPYRHHIFKEASKVYPTLVVYLNRYCTARRGWNPFPRKYHYNYVVLSENRGILNVLKNIVLLLSIVLNYKPRIIIIGGHSEVEMKIAAILSKILRLKLIYWTESSEMAESKFPFLQRNLSKLQRIFFSKISNAVIVPGKLSYISERKILRKERVFIVPNSIDETAWLMFSQSKENNSEIPQKDISKLPLLLFVGRVTRIKGIIPLVTASIRLLNEGCEFTLLIVGDGPLREPLENVIRRRKYSDRIVFLGSISEEELLSELYKNADVFILPSYVDVWGFVINEAALFGKLIIASKYSQAAYILLEGTPLLLDDVSVEKIYQVIKSYLDSRHSFDKYKSLIEERYRKYFNPTLSYRAVKEAIQTVCSEE